MAFDPLSPIAPARVRAVVLPVGRLKKSRYAEFLKLLREQSAVRLGDVTPDSRPDRSMFTPLGFPNGTLLYELSSTAPPPSHVALSPFEFFREALVIVGVADALEYSSSGASHEGGESSEGGSRRKIEISSLAKEIELIQERFPKALIHRLCLFDLEPELSPSSLPKGTFIVPPYARRNATTMKTMMCDLTSALLAELTTLAKSIQGLPSIPSPGAPKAPPSHEQSRRWTTMQSLNTSRSNPQVDQIQRADSPRNPDRNINRMSTPVHSSSPSSVTSSLRDDSLPTSPASGTSTPPTTFDEIAAGNSTAEGKRPGSGLRSGTTHSPRSMSSERVSVQGFGSGGILERARNKGKCRVGIVIGSLYLCAGRWQDALRECAENAEQARLLSDHLWHAKGLENMVVCMLLLAWGKCEFQVPKICFPEDALSPSSQKALSNAPPLQNLKTIFPGLVNMILGLYARASNFQGEDLPQLPFSETVIRLSKISAALNISGGGFSENCLGAIVKGAQDSLGGASKVSRVSITPTRSDIMSILFRAFPFSFDPSELSVIDHTRILAGISSVLTSIGMHRKKAIVMKEFIETIIPALVQARKIGAAEMGVHPAAGLTAIQQSGSSFGGGGSINSTDLENESGVHDFLDLLGFVYGVPGTGRLVSSSVLSTEDQAGAPETSNEDQIQQLVNSIVDDSRSRAFGNLNLKLDILRLCINFCEALPHFQGVLHFTTALLRIAGPGNAPHSNTEEVIVSLGREEQIRLASSISRTVSSAKQLGLNEVGANYWDDFLVRGMEFVLASGSKIITPHLETELEIAAKTPKGVSPFIHDRFSKQLEPKEVENVFVAKEEHQFIVALQNPYEFEVEIESLDIATEDIAISSNIKSLYLGPYRTQKFAIPIVIEEAGEGTVVGCIIKVKGCKKKFFPIFAQPWSPEWPPKLKDTSLDAPATQPLPRRVSTVSSASEMKTTQPGYPVSQIFEITAISEQPLLVLSDVTLPQSAMMILEGERQSFSITLQNTSSIGVDFIRISMQDSASVAMRSALTNKDISPADIYELETQLVRSPALTVKRKEIDSTVIAPGSFAEFEVEVLGKPALENALIRFSYAFVGEKRETARRRFFTRDVLVPITFTVNAGIQLHRLDVSPFVSDFAWSNQQRRTSGSKSTSESQNQNQILEPRNAEQNGNRFSVLLNRIGLTTDGSEHCLVLLDLRNVWPTPLTISLQVLESTSAPSTPINATANSEEESRRVYTVHETIQPGHVSRIVLVLNKIALSDPHAPIPPADPSKARQFVVSASVPPDIERANREAFWFREELLKRIRGTWQEQGTQRTGAIELRGLRLNGRMVEALKKDDITVEFSLRSDEPPSSSSTTRLQHTGRSSFTVAVDSFLALTTRVTNRSAAPRHLLLRLQPSLCNLPHTAALDLDKKLAWTGVLQRPLPVLPPGESVDVALGLCALCTGAFEIGATVEEVRLLDEPDEEVVAGEKRRSGRSRTDTGLLMDSLLDDKQRKVWHSVEACTIVAVKEC